MRIIAGKYRGQVLRTLKTGNLRPTSDQMRETLFDVLGPSVAGCRFLDAYAGSGAVGIEALSRGAEEVIFIEHHRPAARLIRHNIESLDRDSGVEVMTCEVVTGFERLSGQGAVFDYVFLDPPYDEIRQYHYALRQLARLRLLSPEGCIIAEHSRRCLLEEQYGNLRRARKIRHGDTELSFYHARDP